MPYSADILRKRVTVLNRLPNITTGYGVTTSYYTPVATIWAGVDWTRGIRAMREGALDAYDTFMIRCGYHSFLTRESRLMLDDGRVLQLDSFHSERRSDTVQATATELIDQLPVVMGVYDSSAFVRLYNWSEGSTLSLSVVLPQQTATCGPFSQSDHPTLSGLASAITASQSPLTATVFSSDTLRIYNPDHKKITSATATTTGGSTTLTTILTAIYTTSALTTEVPKSIHYRYLCGTTFYRWSGTDFIPE